MTAIGAINHLDRVFPNTIPLEEKISWLWQCDLSIINDILSRYEDVEIPPMGQDPYNMDRQVLLPEPYDRAYTHWLSAQINLVNKEIENYNSDLSNFYDVLAAYGAQLIRTHMPKSAGRIRF